MQINKDLLILGQTLRDNHLIGLARAGKPLASAKGYKVEKYLNLQNNINLPEGLETMDTLNVSKTSIASLPKGLKVGKNLILNSVITSLPDNLKVGWNLFVGEAIAALPRGLEVGGSLHIRGSTLTVLPKDLKVGKHLYLNAAVCSIPGSVQIGGDIRIDRPVSEPSQGERNWLVWHDYSPSPPLGGLGVN